MTKRKAPTWRDNADEFAALDQGKGWPFARLVACSVEKGRRPPKTGYPSDWKDKVGAETFAERCQTGTDRVLRHLEAWGKATADGLCQSAAELTPGDAHTIVDPDAKFTDYYSARDTNDGKPKLYAGRAMADPELRRDILSDMSSADRQQLVTEIIHTDPAAAEAIVADSDAHLEVIKASSRRAEANPPRLARAETTEPFARLLTTLRLEAIWTDTQAMRRIVLDQFSGHYVWRPGELERVLDRIDTITATLADVRAVLTSEVSDQELAQLMEGGS